MWNLLFCSLSLEKNTGDSVSTYLSHLNCHINNEDFASWVSFCLSGMTSVWTVIHRKNKTRWHYVHQQAAACQHQKKVLIGEAQFQFNNMAYLPVNTLLSKTSASECDMDYVTFYVTIDLETQLLSQTLSADAWLQHEFCLCFELFITSWSLISDNNWYPGRLMLECVLLKLKNISVFKHVPLPWR